MWLIFALWNALCYQSKYLSDHQLEWVTRAEVGYSPQWSTAATSSLNGEIERNKSTWSLQWSHHLQKVK